LGKLFLWQINSMLIDHIIHVPLLTPLHFSKRCMKSNKFVTSWNIMIIALVALHEGSQKSSIKVSFRCTLGPTYGTKPLVVVNALNIQIYYIALSIRHYCIATPTPSLPWFRWCLGEIRPFIWPTAWAHIRN